MKSPLLKRIVEGLLKSFVEEVDFVDEEWIMMC